MSFCRLARVFFVGVACCHVGVGLSQTYPNKPIRLVTAEVGGTADIVSRLLIAGISGPLGQQVIVDNRGGGIIPGEIVAKAPPDGYTLLLSASLWITPLLQDVSYSPTRDFSPIALVVTTPNLLVVHPSVAVSSVKELIALAKAKPGQLNYASSTNGSSPHLAGELFKAMAGVNMVAVPYRGSGPGLLALIGGQVQVMLPAGGGMSANIESGKVKALAVTSAEQSALFPDLPTVAASGLPGYETGLLIGVYAPAKTPDAVISRLNHEMVRFLKTAEAKKRFLNVGTETVGSTAEQLTATMKAGIVKWTKVIKDARMRENSSH